MAGCLWPDKNKKIDVAQESFIPEGDWSAEEERRIVRKMDNRILLPCFIMMFLGYLDRQNMANAKVLNSGTDESIEASWNLTGVQFNWVISIYGIGLFLCEPFSNFLLKKMSAPKWFSRIMVTWGAIVMCQAVVHNFAGAMATRFFLGVAEAGLLPGVPYYLSFWYTQRERGKRMGVSFTGLGVAGMVGGFIAIGVSNMNGLGGLFSWQWLFILEGIPAIIYGVKDIAVRRLPPNAPSALDKITKDDILKELADPVLWLFFFFQFLIAIPIAGSSALLPSIIQGLGFKTSVQANGIAALSHGCNTIAILINSWHSDWTNERIKHIIFTIAFFPLVGSLPLAITALNPSAVPAGVRLLFVLLAGLTTSAYPIIWAYRANSSKGTGRATVNSAFTLTAYAGALVVGPFLFPNKDAPNYVPGMFASYGCYAISLLCFIPIPYILRYQAAKNAEDMQIMESGHHEAIAIPIGKVAPDASIEVAEKAAEEKS
ncbi:major facilitator superfamily domain-containing protein [Hyaloraphidium curvatum]|nr:major facilitator superfamily domain-containing protein [Hyaloraphidium curvatum]